MTKPTSALVFIEDPSALDAEAVTKGLLTLHSRVTSGRHLIVVWRVDESWNGQLPIEGLVVQATLGEVRKRRSEWEFFGNGAIRSYRGKKLTYDGTYQWIAMRRSGDKPYSRKRDFSSKILRENEVPVSDKAFTRDVANNVWNLRSEGLRRQVFDRFSALLAWIDEDFILSDLVTTKHVRNRKALDLDNALIGVAHKIPYVWDEAAVLF